MPGASAFAAVDALFADEGGICAVLADWRNETPPPSLEACCDRIEQIKGFRPPRETVRRWMAEQCQ